ncbi:hypothetical protein QTP81_02310 [Alteromonas sp. ASW11-36]|uniref:Uncharacterized protein n=1 Tax=Alteromonas arenosi TaxID=3055817 RepID=A0ABT7STB5_9ALTE|nr:hypothetical protein [Alteromonas sp. ASW11-36]MDM7859436.1 hypothetical protein [Alteromonas sp. ASW11-36]
MLARLFIPQEKYDGIRPFNIYFMRAIYLLMFFVLGKDVWSHILTHEGPWQEMEAIAWSVWAAFSGLAALGVFRPVEMIPLLLLEIFYKVLWLVIFAWPLASSGQLEGSGSEATVFAFGLVLLPILAVPWGYVVKKYLLNSHVPVRLHN